MRLQHAVDAGSGQLREGDPGASEGFGTHLRHEDREEATSGGRGIGPAPFARLCREADPGTHIATQTQARHPFIIRLHSTFQRQRKLYYIL